MSLAQWRSGEVSRELVAAVRNEGPEPVFFAELQLVSESFATLPPRRVGTLLGRTPRTDLKLPYGEARCDPERIPPVRPAEVVARLRVGEGPLRTVRFPIPHPDPLLSRLVAADCGAFLVRQAARVEFGEAWTERKGALRGVLTVTRVRDGGPIVVERLYETTHYNLRPGAPVRAGRVAVLGAGESRVEVPVEVTPLRCDAHGFADAKKAFEFAVAASAGGGEAYPVVVSLPAGLRPMFLEYALRTCGLPAPA